MKYQIRKSVWESNSSSMHSLVVTKKNSNIRMTQEEIRHEFYLDEDWYKERHKNNEKEIVKIDPWDNEFGRSPFDVLVTFTDKLAYAVAEYCGDNYSIESYVKSEKTFDEIFRPLLIRLIGCDDIEWDRWDDRPFEIYVGGGDNLDAVICFQRVKPVVIPHGRAVNTVHSGDGRSGDIRVHNADTVSLQRHQIGQRRCDQRFSDSSLPAYHTDHMTDVGIGIFFHSKF